MDARCRIYLSYLMSVIYHVIHASELVTYLSVIKTLVAANAQTQPSPWCYEQYMPCGMHTASNDPLAISI